MCGIAGLFDPDAGFTRAELEADASAMTAAVAHRGPDGHGVFVDERAGVALGHRRLSVIDVSDAGAQPMGSADGRYWLTYNGEVYNHSALRRRLQDEDGVTLRGESDTEVLLEAFAAWGLERALERVDGMYAFALWDARDRRLHLARDRFGEKPLYLARAGRTVLFGSELRAIRAHPRFDPTLSMRGASSMLQLGYIPAPWSIHENAERLPHGTLVTLGRGTRSERRLYSQADVARRAAATPLALSPVDAAARVEERLRASVRARLVSDVPLGAFLSGGVDSAAVVALAQEESSAPLATFCVSFDEPDLDESHAARAVAAHLGTRHTTFPFRASDARALLDQLPGVLDEPFADPSQLPTLFLCQRAREHVTVALTGDGGDELFSGYTRHARIARASRALRLAPAAARRVFGRALRAVARARTTRGPAALPRPLGLPLERLLDGGRLDRLAELIESDDPSDLYLRQMAAWQRPDRALKAGPGLLAPDGWSAPDADADLRLWLALTDAQTYLADGVLTKLDRASMAVALECRPPMLEPQLLELAWRLSPAPRGPSKAPLRDMLASRLPRELIDTNKRGFGVPLDRWLRGPLSDWAEGMLLDSRLAQSGVLDREELRRRLREHREGRARWHTSLWHACVLAAFCEHNALS